MSSVHFELCQAGYCNHPEMTTIKGGSYKICKFPSLFGLIRHPQEGIILYDTGYHPIYNELNTLWPEGLYPKLLPAFIHKNETAACQLIEKGLNPEDVTWIIISHFHADHIAGLIDFPRAKFLCLKSAFDGVTQKSRWRNLRNGFLADLLPMNFHDRVVWINDKKTTAALDSWQFPFTAFDLFNDQSLIAVELPGHKMGQIGLALKSKTQGDCFLIADAAWSTKAIAELRPPGVITRLLFDDGSQYVKTLAELHKLQTRRPEIHMLPSHCQEAFTKFRNH